MVFIPFFAPTRPIFSPEPGHTDVRDYLAPPAAISRPTARPCSPLGPGSRPCVQSSGGRVHRRCETSWVISDPQVLKGLKRHKTGRKKNITCRDARGGRAQEGSLMAGTSAQCTNSVTIQVSRYERKITRIRPVDDPIPRARVAMSGKFRCASPPARAARLLPRAPPHTGHRHGRADLARWPRRPARVIPARATSAGSDSRMLLSRVIPCQNPAAFVRAPDCSPRNWVSCRVFVSES